MLRNKSVIVVNVQLRSLSSPTRLLGDVHWDQIMSVIKITVDHQQVDVDNRNTISSHLLTPFSNTSSTRLDASCKKVLFEMLDKRLSPLISEIDERLDEPGTPNRLEVDFSVEFLSCGTVSLVGLSKPFDKFEWLYPLVVPFVFSSRVFDLDNRFLNVPNMPVFFLSRPRSSTLPVIGSADDSLFC